MFDDEREQHKYWPMMQYIYHHYDLQPQYENSWNLQNNNSNHMMYLRDVPWGSSSSFVVSNLGTTWATNLTILLIL